MYLINTKLNKSKKQDKENSTGRASHQFCRSYSTDWIERIINNKKIRK